MVLTDSSIVKGVNAFKKFYDAETLMEVVSLFIQKTDSHFFILVYQSLLSLEHYRCFSSRRCPRGMIHLVPSPTPQITLTLYNCLSGRGCYLYIQWYFNLWYFSILSKFTFVADLQSLEAWQEVCSAANLPHGGRYKEFFPLLKAAYNVISWKWWWWLWY